jgi:hypothetical protein
MERETAKRSLILEESGPGMKVMLLDSHTTPMVSLAFAQSALMRQEVYLLERLSTTPPWEDFRHLKCICMLKPEPATIANLCSELAKPGTGHTTSTSPTSWPKHWSSSLLRLTCRRWSRG